jgi:hypothetical protein
VVQALGHGIVFPRLAKARYSPGFLACLFLHLPIGIAYIRQISREQPVERTDWLRAVIYAMVIAAGGLAAPQQLFKDKESPYRFTDRQMGPYLPGEKRQEGSLSVSRFP